MSISKEISEFKAAMCGARNRSQLMLVVESACGLARFDYDASYSISDNAHMAKLCEKSSLANVLEFAAKQERHLCD